MSVLIADTTSAAKSGIFSVSAGDNVSIAVSGTIATNEFIDVQYTDDGGTTWHDLFQDGSQVRLTDTNNMATIYGPGIFKLDKGATASAAGAIRFS